MKNNKSSKLLRRIELLSLFISIIIWPLLFFISGIFMWVTISKNSGSILGYFAGLLFITFGLVWNTKLLAGSYLFVSPFKNYIHNIESNTDVICARVSFLSFLIIILILTLII